MVDIERIEAGFTVDRKHRMFLKIPFIGRTDECDLCVIGQNPSCANESFADSTVAYLEQYVHRNFPEYSAIIMLNLYSRVDTEKLYVNDITRQECQDILTEIIQLNNDFLIVWGKLVTKGNYNFLERANFVKPTLIRKHLLKLDIGTQYAPHPRNRKIHLSNYTVGTNIYNFEDIGN